MCFSPTVSFAASAVLAVAGFATLKKVTSKKEYALAFIPLMFAVHQFIEGMIWVVLEHGGPDNIEYLLTQIYTFFAGMLWPVLIPFSIFMIEQDSKKRKLLLFITILGACFATYTLVGIFLVGVVAQIDNLHIVYHHPWENNQVLLTYVIATCAPFFVSSNKRVMHLGVINMIAFFIAYYFYNFYLASVWCFFAALMSGSIYLFFIREHKYNKMLVGR